MNSTMIESSPGCDQAEKNLDILRKALALLGYRPGSPPGLEANTAIDENISAGLRCCRCKRKAMSFHPFHRPYRTYLAVMVCQHCGNVSEA